MPAFNARRRVRRAGATSRAAAIFGLAAANAAAQVAPPAGAPSVALASATPAPDPFHELETKYLFGFTEGADIGEQGEQSIEFENTGAFTKRGGSYSALEQEIEYESVPTQYFGYELSAHGMYHEMKNV